MLDMNDEKLKRGYIRLFRAIDSWEWYTDVNTFKLFVHCLIKANHIEKPWRGLIIQPGSFATSIEKLSEATGLTIQQTRTALNRLKSTNELTCKSTNQYSIITVNNYNLYQDNNILNNKQITNEQQTSNKQITTTNKVNNINNINNNKVESSKKSNFVAKSFFQKLFTEDGEFYKYSHLKDLFIEFLEYKTAIKKQYKTENSVRKAFLDFVRLSKNDEKYAHALVDNAIARGWQSIYDLSQEQKNALKEEKETNNAKPINYTLGETETYKGETGWTL